MNKDPFAQFDAVLEEMRQLHRKKQEDYATTEDPFANVRSSEAYGIPAYVMAAIRAGDKLRRIAAFWRKGRLENEGVEDSFIDGAIYLIIGLVLYREHVRKQERKEAHETISKYWEETQGRNKRRTLRDLL